MYVKLKPVETRKEEKKYLFADGTPILAAWAVSVVLAFLTGNVV